MKKLLFSHSYFLRFDPKQWETGQPYAPLGTMYAAALMRQKGYEVSLFDTMFANSPTEVLPSFDTNPDFFVVYDDGFNYLTKMCLTNMRDAAFEMIRMAKDRGCIVIVSSSDSTDRYDQYLDAGADFILIGEAELSLLELVNTISNGEANYFNIQGLAFRQSGATVKTPKRNVMKELDALPFPAWDLVDLEPYRQSWLKHAGYFSMNMGTTRGCPFKCNWCAKPIYGNRYNSRSPQNVVEELKMLKRIFGFDHIWFCDDIFGLKPGWVHEFANLIEDEDLKFKFKIQARVDLLLQENYIRDLARAGDAMDKGTRVEQIFAATRLLKKHGINPSFFIQFGYPGETKEDIKLTIRMINELLPHEIGISVSYPLPGTVFHEKVKSELREKTNWTDSDELALMFRNTYHPKFYKQLHRYVHKSYRMHVASASMRNILRGAAKLNLFSLKKALSYFYYLPASVIDRVKLNRLEKAGI
jgi:anaerobic magnesium-protoporphyrin IX monomethyl ester cyclase